MKKFKRIYIEITNNCNLSCSFCSIDNKAKRFMTLEEFETILKRIDQNTNYVYLHVKGEPLLHPELDGILKLCSKYNKHVNITTNGTLLKERLEILKNNKCVRQINISLHSENNKNHYLDDIFVGTNQLSEDKYIIYRFWTLKDYKLDEKTKETINKIIEYYNLSPEIVDKIYNEENINIMKNIYINKDNQFIWPDLDNDYVEEHGYCYGLNTHVAILVDGTVIPCCLDSKGIINLGNIYKDDLNTILSSERTLKMIEGFKNRFASEELCKHCSFKAKFDKK